MRLMLDQRPEVRVGAHVGLELLGLVGRDLLQGAAQPLACGGLVARAPGAWGARPLPRAPPHPPGGGALAPRAQLFLAPPVAQRGAVGPVLEPVVDEAPGLVDVLGGVRAPAALPRRRREGARAAEA